MTITIDRREAIRLLLLIDSAMDSADTAREYVIIHDKIRDAVDRWDEKHGQGGRV